MNWLAFSYSLSAKSSTLRVAVWRRLKRVGAVALAGGVYVLPSRDDCFEAFMWMAQEVRQAGGEALLIHVERVEGMADQDLIQLFREARQEDYLTLTEQIVELEDALSQCSEPEARFDLKDKLDHLHKQHAEIARIDYFDCPERAALLARLTHLRQATLPEPLTPVAVPARYIADYRDARWVTRPMPYVDRAACAWLIRRFINPDATIRYATEPAADETPFDMADAEFSHQGDLCTFEVLLRAFDLDDPVLHAIGEIVHEIDLRDGLYARPQTEGVEALLRGWQQSGASDLEMEERGLLLFDGLRTALAADLRSP